MTELEQVLLGLQDDRSVHVVVLTGGARGYFVAHADLDDLRAIGQGQPVEGDPSSWGTDAVVARLDAPADDRRRQRPSVGRRLRAVAGVHDAGGRRQRPLRPTRGQRRDHPRCRGHAALAAARRAGPRGRARAQRTGRAAPPRRSPSAWPTTRCPTKGSSTPSSSGRRPIASKPLVCAGGGQAGDARGPVDAAGRRRCASRASCSSGCRPAPRRSTSNGAPSTATSAASPGDIVEL